LSPVEQFLKSLDGRIISVGVGHQLLRNVEADVGVGYFRFPNRICSSLKPDAESVTVDWEKVIRLRVKANDEAIDTDWHEVVRIPGYIQPPYLLVGPNLFEPLQGGIEQSSRTVALLQCLCRGVERVLDVTYVYPEHREQLIHLLFNMRQSLDFEVWNALASSVALLAGARWLNVEQALASAAVNC